MASSSHHLMWRENTVGIFVTSFDVTKILLRANIGHKVLQSIFSIPDIFILSGEHFASIFC